MSNYKIYNRNNPSIHNSIIYTNKIDIHNDNSSYTTYNTIIETSSKFAYTIYQTNNEFITYKLSEENIKYNESYSYSLYKVDEINNAIWHRINSYSYITYSYNILNKNISYESSIIKDIKYFLTSDKQFLIDTDKITLIKYKEYDSENASYMSYAYSYASNKVLLNTESAYNYSYIFNGNINDFSEITELNDGTNTRYCQTTIKKDYYTVSEYKSKFNVYLLANKERASYFDIYIQGVDSPVKLKYADGIMLQNIIAIKNSKNIFYNAYYSGEEYSYKYNEDNDKFEHISYFFDDELFIHDKLANITHDVALIYNVPSSILSYNIITNIELLGESVTSSNIIVTEY